MLLDSLQIKQDPNEQQMPKRSQSRQAERARSMVGARNPKPAKEKPKPAKEKAASSDMAQQAPKGATGGQGKAVSSDTGAGRSGKPITIPLSDVSPELKAILVKEMINGEGLKWLRVRVRLRVRVSEIDLVLM